MTSKAILEEIRDCLFSTICGDDKKLLPDYMCEKTNQKCILYKEPFCEKTEKFPEDHNT